MRDFKIYLAGGMQDLSENEQRIWRRLVTERLLNQLYEKDYKVNLIIIDPCEYYNFHNPSHDTDLEVMKFDIRHVKSSDLIIVNFNDPKSIGTASELAIAYNLDIPIIGLNIHNDELHPWLKCFCDKIFNDINKLIDYVIDFYLT